ncbi:hypothetical protein BCV71DRAFT_283834 [Rhizopus microsporus]|uniref:Uncharacterized protein n=1 Tax=Rhizopus microsporus TaxID=58291 RepID=A0A1X0S4M3_RHIZD|nr:hypothetical protein BCV71DRAFT_283834 [Rhizopus microsporus]
MLSTSDSVTKYMPQSTRVLVKNELNRLYSAAPVPSTNLLVWTNTLRTLRVGWMEMKKKCNEIITDTIKIKDTNDLIASFILFELVPRLTKEVDADETGEDTFLATCEVKPPSKVGRGDISDFVKLGIEMRHMLDEILSIGVDDASVLDILVEDNFFIKKSGNSIIFSLFAF